MSERADHIAGRLRQKGAESVEFFQTLPRKAWHTIIYADGMAWNARQVLCHFVATERAFLRLFKNVLSGGEGTPENFDLDVFNERQVAKLDGQPPDDLIAAFEAARAETIALVEGMDDADLDREGRHPFFGVDRMEKFAKLVYRHNMIHERDIRRALEDHQPDRNRSTT
jgi:uncharacterized protein (TIGR03083 family)